MTERTAAVLRTPGPISTDRLLIEALSVPPLQPGQVLVTVRACGVCRTDLNIVEGDLPPHRPSIVPGHQIVGVVSAGCAGRRPFRRDARRYFVARQYRRHVPVLPRRPRESLRPSDLHRLRCRWRLRYRRDRSRGLCAPARRSARRSACCAVALRRDYWVSSLARCGRSPGERVGLYGFGASAHLALPILKEWGCSVFVVTRGANHRDFAEKLGADWVGRTMDATSELSIVP